MLESVTEQPKRIRLPKRVSWRLGGLLSFAGLIGLLGFFLPTMLAQQAAWAAAIGLGLSAGLMFLSARQHQIKSAMALQVAQTAIRHDSCPSLVSCVDGTVLYANDAAKQRFGDDLGGDVSATLANYVANPDGTTFRLVALAQQKGAVQEEIITRDGTMHISAHQIGSEKYLWRIDETAPAAPMDAAPALPTLILGSSGAVLSANDAATALAGHPVKTLADLFPVLPLVSGEIVEISCVHGTTQALISEVDMGAGRKAIYLLPPVEPRKPDGEWTAFQDLPVPLVKVTPDGMIESFNRMATALVGTSLAENVHLSKLMEGLGRSITDWLTEMIEGRSGQNSEFLRLKRTDKEMFIQVTLNKVVEGGTPSLIAVLSDATELKSLEAQFVQSQKMQAIGQLAGGVAHDFNNLLTAISGHCDLLLLRHDQGDPDFSDLVQINQNANRAAALVGQLLAFSRKQTLRPEIVDMRDTLADLTHLLNRLVGEKVTLTLSHDPVLKAIRADKRQLEQVLMNLVVNARDAMPEGGAIRIEITHHQYPLILINGLL